MKTRTPPPMARLYSGKEAVTRFWQEFFAESPDAHLTIEDIFGMGFRCVMLLEIRVGWMLQAKRGMCAALTSTR